MAISNKQKRQLTCQFCPRKKDKCQCKKYWKTVYNENRDIILEIYHSQQPPQSQTAQKNSTPQ